MDIDEYKKDPRGSRPVPIAPSNLPFHHVKARLESEENQDWLLVIDDTQDLPEHFRVSDFLPTSNHGTIIWLRSRKDLRLALLLHAGKIEVNGLKPDAAAGMSLARCSEEYPSMQVLDENKSTNSVH